MMNAADEERRSMLDKATHIRMMIETSREPVSRMI